MENKTVGSGQWAGGSWQEAVGRRQWAGGSGQEAVGSSSGQWAVNNERRTMK